MPQIFGETAVTTWALPCTPVTNNANHPDHLPHLASEVASLLSTHASHAISGTTGGATVSTFGSHTHTFSYTATHAAHAGNSGELTHAHEETTDALDKDGSEAGGTAAEHTYHRSVPNVDQPVWVMFVAGDGNFPVWMGVLSDQ